MLKDRDELEQNLIKPTLEIKRRRNIVKDIKRYLSETYSIFDGSVQSWINNPAEELQNIDTRLLFLFAEQIYQKTGNQSINPEEYFTKAEIKTSKQFTGKLFVEDDIEFPLKFQPVIQFSHYSWSCRIHIKLLVQLLNSRLLNWNPESQREATYKVVNGDIIETATIYMPNVIEMKKLLKKGKLENTQLTFNCSIGTADNGEEVTYDNNNFELLVHEGTKIDVVDGYHRILASQMALSESPDIDFYFDLKILNLTVDRAAQYLAQISKGTKISETKRKQMAKDTFSSLIIDELKNKSELRNRISKKEGLTDSRKELVTYNTLEYAIDKYFPIEKKAEMYDISDYLIEFYDVLIGRFEDEFTINYPESKKTTLIVDNNMFVGYTLLASRMKKVDIEARNIVKYIKEIDFSRNNKMWVEIGVLDEKGKLAKNPRIGIEEYFNNISL